MINYERVLKRTYVVDGFDRANQKAFSRAYVRRRLRRCKIGSRALVGNHGFEREIVRKCECKANPLIFLEVGET